MANLDEINRSLSGDPQYRAALNGEVNFGQFPTGPDGKVLPGFRVENARAYAASKGMNNGYAVNDKGEFYDQNATHWYDPQYLGPLAVGAATGLGALGAFGGGAPAAASGGVGSAAAANPGAYIGADVLGAEAAASPAGIAPNIFAPLAGNLPAGGAGLSAGAGSGAASAAGAAGGIGKFLADNKNVIGAALGIGGGLLGRKLMPQQPTTVPVPPELQQLLTEATRRTMNQGPLSDAITQQALASLPSYARK